MEELLQQILNEVQALTENQKNIEKELLEIKKDYRDLKWEMRDRFNFVNERVEGLASRLDKEGFAKIRDLK